MFWPQKDIQPNEFHEPSLGKKVLVASRSSEFKDAVVERIKAAFKDEPVYLKFIGLEPLEKEDGAKYSAVVLINTCMSWDMDRNVKAFLKRHKEQSHIIVLTTSRSGWLPKMKEHNVDAISSASQKEKVDVVADEIITKIRLLLQWESK
jgi:hypothetical protein